MRSDYNDLGLLEPSILGASDQYSPRAAYEFNDNTLWAKIRVQLEFPRCV